jgi:hypothetical protein
VVVEDHDGLGASPAWRAQGLVANGLLGSALAGVGDVDGDGFDDVIASAPAVSDPETREGAVYLWRGSASGLGAVPDWSVSSDQAQGQLGSGPARRGRCSAMPSGPWT